MLHKRGCQARRNSTAPRLANRRYTNFSSQQPSIIVNVRGFYLKGEATPCFSKAEKGKKILRATAFPSSRPTASARLDSFKISPNPCLPFKVPTPANGTRGILHFKKASLCLIPQPIYSSRGGGILGRIYTSRRRALLRTERTHAAKGR